MISLGIRNDFLELLYNAFDCYQIQIIDFVPNANDFESII